MQLPTLRQLEYLVAVDEHRSFVRAAAACHVSQPGLSDQVRRLEETLGVRLFERDRRGVRSTAAGEALAARAADVLTRARDLADAARAYAKPLSGPLRMGVIPTVAPYLLPMALPGVRARHPELRLLLREAQTASLIEGLEAGDLDVLLLALEAPLGGAATLALFEDPFHVAAPEGHALARRREVGEADLAEGPVLLLEDGHCLRDQALAACASAAPGPEDLRATSLPTLVQMVAAGEGVTLLPEMALGREAAAGLVTRPLSPTAGRTIGLAWRKTSARGEEFVLLGDSIRAVMADRG